MQCAVYNFLKVLYSQKRPTIGKRDLLQRRKRGATIMQCAAYNVSKVLIIRAKESYYVGKRDLAWPPPLCSAWHTNSQKQKKNKKVLCMVTLTSKFTTPLSVSLSLSLSLSTKPRTRVTLLMRNILWHWLLRFSFYSAYNNVCWHTFSGTHFFFWFFFIGIQQRVLAHIQLLRPRKDDFSQAWPQQCRLLEHAGA
jgi:hypothetical protein